MSSGEIWNEDYMRKCKLYSMQMLKRYCRGGISPTDIDGLYFAHCRLRGGRGILWEFKTEGSHMSEAQKEAHEFWIGLGKGCVLGIVAEHPNLDMVEPITDITRFCVFGWIDDRIVYSRWFDDNAGERLGNLTFAFFDNAMFLDGFLPWLAKEACDV